VPASRIDVFLPFMLTSQVEGSNNRHSRSTRLYNLRPLTVFSRHCERVRPAFGGGFEPPRRASWLCFARSAAFVVTHGAPPLSAVTPAEGGWATSDALEGTIQTAPLSPVGFVSRRPQDDHNLFPEKDFVPFKPVGLALFRSIGTPVGRAVPAIGPAGPVGFVSQNRPL